MKGFCVSLRLLMWLLLASATVFAYLDHTAPFDVAYKSVGSPYSRMGLLCCVFAFVCVILSYVFSKRFTSAKPAFTDGREKPNPNA